MNRYCDRNPNQNRQMITRMVDRRRIHNGNYSPDKYRCLIPAQREAVRDMRRQAYRNHRNSRNDSSNRNHNVNAVGHSNEPGEATGDGVEGTNEPPSSPKAVVRFAPAGNVGSYLGNRRNYQAFRGSYPSA